MLSKKERDWLRDDYSEDHEDVQVELDVQELREILDTCDTLEAERDKLSKCLEPLGFVPDAPEADLRTAVDDYVALAASNANERIEAMAERDRLRALCRDAADTWDIDTAAMAACGVESVSSQEMIHRLREAGKESNEGES